MRRITTYILTILVALVAIIPIYPISVEASTIPPTSNFKGAPIMFMDMNKATKKDNGSGAPIIPSNSDFVSFEPDDPRDPLSVDQFSDFTLHEMQIRISGFLPGGQDIVGTTLSVVDYQKTSENGYPMINAENLSEWTNLLGGDWNFISQQITSYTITPRNTTTAFKLYSLSQLVVLCGGKGTTDGFVKHPNPPYNWVKFQTYANFEQTKVPTANIGQLNPSYPIDQPITIIGTATAYSSYDTHVRIDNFSVYNKTNTTQYTQLEAPGQYGSTWSKSFTFTPATAGTYEITLSVTDYHKRKTETYPIKKTFTVGVAACTNPTTATLKISGQADRMIYSDDSYTMPSGKNTINSLVFSTAGTLKVNDKVVGSGTTFSNILVSSTAEIIFTPTNNTYCEFTYTFHPSSSNPDPGGNCDYTIHVMTLTSTGKGEINMDMPSDANGPAVNLDAKTDYLELSSDMVGTFYIGDHAINLTPGKSAVLDSFSIEVFTLRFESSDGTECWSKKFYLDKGQGEVKCPVITRSSDVISNGDVITDVPLNGSLTLESTYQDENRNTQTAMLKWRVKRPDGITSEFMWDNERVWRLMEWHQLQVPFAPSGWPANKQLKFDIPGTYEITYFYDSTAPWAESNCPPWTITVVISACTNLSIKTELNGSIQYTDGDGTPGNEYIVKLPTTLPVTAKFTLRDQQHDTSYMGNWLLRRTNDAVPVATGNSQNPFSYTFTDGDSYILTVRTLVAGVWCEKTILISGTTCEGLSLEGFVNDRPIQRTGSGTADDPYVIKIQGGKNNYIELQMKNGSSSRNADWILKRGGSTINTVNTNSFTYKLTDSNEEYTLEIKVDLNGTICNKYVRFQVDGVPTFNCDQLGINGVVNASPINNPTGNGSPGSPFVVKIIGGQANDIVIGLDLPGSDASISAEWTLKRGNTTIKTETRNSFSYLLPDSTETYTLVAKVQNKTEYCYVYVRFEKESMGCNDVYLHFFDGKQNSYNVAPAPGHAGSKTIKGSKADRIILLVGTRPDTILDAQLIDVTFDAPLPNQNTFDPDSIYERFNIPAGTYQIKITVNDPTYPILNGCSFIFTLVVDPDANPEPDPGGGQDGGKIKINIYDSTNRLLQNTSDGVWEREPARIEVIIDQAKIDEAFQRIDAEIKKAIDEKEAEYLGMYPAPDYEDVEVTPSPPTWNSKTNPGTEWPASLTLTINGPGNNQSFSLNPKLPQQSNTYTGSITPTQTTWLATLQSQKYQAKVDSFTIRVPYTVEFSVSYQKCERKSPGEDPDTGEPLPEEKECIAGSDSGAISNAFSITVQGDQTQFEVFEPNAKGSLLHTTEWSEYHSRDRYPRSNPNDFYAGERMLTRVQLEDRHRHPYSAQFPSILSAQAWISETGKRNTPLQSLFSLQSFTSRVWGGPSQMIAKLGRRENGVDTPLMGDKQRGFQKGSSYAVYYRVQFAFGVEKGFTYLNKSSLLGRNLEDYKVPFFIIANAWERQGIRNHTSH